MPSFSALCALPETPTSSACPRPPARELGLRLLHLEARLATIPDLMRSFPSLHNPVDLTDQIESTSYGLAIASTVE
jgi:hypothetical protein